MIVLLKTETIYTNFISTKDLKYIGLPYIYRHLTMQHNFFSLKDVSSMLCRFCFQITWVDGYREHALKPYLHFDNRSQNEVIIGS